MWYSTDGEDQIWFQLEAISLFLINVMAERVFFFCTSMLIQVFGKPSLLLSKARVLFDFTP
jgi:hypothetical protein